MKGLLKKIFGPSPSCKKNINKGRLALSSNSPSQIKVKTGFTPCSVSITFIDHCFPPVCAGGRDCFDIIIVNDGFVLYSKIESNCRTIEWKANRLSYAKCKNNFFKKKCKKRN